MTVKAALRRTRRLEKGACRKALACVNGGDTDSAGDDIAGGFRPHSPEEKEYFMNKNRGPGKRVKGKRSEQGKKSAIVEIDPLDPAL